MQGNENNACPTLEMKAEREKKSPEIDSPEDEGFFGRLRRRFREAWAPTWKLLTTDVWDVEAAALPYIKRKLVRTTRIFTMVGKGFKQDECGLHASSLTYMTLLSFVPVLALAVSVVKGMSDTEVLRQNSKNFIRSLVADVQLKSEDIVPDDVTNGVPATAVEDMTADNGDAPATANHTTVVNALEDGADPAIEEEDEDAQPGGLTIERIEEMIDSGFDKVEELNFGALGGIGLIFLFWSVIAVLGNIEEAFNKVWGVTKGRTLARKFTDYLSVLIVVPVLIMAASSLPVLKVIQENLNRFDDVLKISQTAGWPVFESLWVLFTTTIAFAFILIFTPNTKVKVKSGIIGGFVCAIGFGLWLKICVALQVGVAKYSTLFGSFAIVPIVLSWVFVSWEILLFSTEVSYAFQNVDIYSKDMGWRNANQKGRFMLAVAIMREAARSIAQGDGLIRLGDFGRRHGLSPRLVRNVVSDLQAGGVLVETAGDSDVVAVRVDIDSYTVGDVVRTLLELGVSPVSLGVTHLSTSSVAGEEIERAIAGGMATKIKDLPDNEARVEADG